MQYCQFVYGGFQYGYEKVEEFGYCGDFVFGVVDIQVEGVGYYFYGDVVDLVDCYQSQQVQGDLFVVIEKVLEWGDQGGFQLLFWVVFEVFLWWGVWFVDNQGGDDVYVYQLGYGMVSVVLGIVVGNVEGVSVGYQYGGVVVENIGGGYGVLEGFVGGIDVVGVNVDILGGGVECYQQCQLGEVFQVVYWFYQCYCCQ